MTIGDWLTERESGAPPQLLHAAREVLGADGASRPAAEAAPVMLAAAERALASWLDHDAGRAGAVPLLTIDALVTLALEAAADDPATIDATAADAMIRLSALAAAHARPGAASTRPVTDSPAHERSR